MKENERREFEKDVPRQSIAGSRLLLKYRKLRANIEELHQSLPEGGAVLSNRTMANIFWATSAMDVERKWVSAAYRQFALVRTKTD